VEEDAAHIQVAMGVAVPAFSRFLWFCVAVGFVKGAIETLLSLAVAIMACGFC
jgi:hypothetical protein